MSLDSAFELLSSLSAFAIAAGLLINLAVQPRRGRADPLLALFGAALLLWGLADLLSPDPRVAATATTLAILLYFLFVSRLLESEITLTVALMLAAPVALVVCAALIWVGGGFSSAAASVPHALVSILLILYASAALWVILISRSALAHDLRAAGLLALITCASLLVFPAWLRSGALLMMAAAAAWIGWVVLRAQYRAPLDALREELRTANSDLRQAGSEAADLRARNQALAQQLQGDGQYRSSFLDRLGHKLRTPLNSITGYAELLQNGTYGDLNEKQQDRLSKIQRNSQVMLDLINNMLELNSINGGRLALNLTPLSLNSVIDQAVGAVAALRGVKPVKLTVELAPDLPPTFADQTRICQVITQMIDNSLKFTLDGEVKVTSRPIHVENGASEQFPLPLKGWLSDGEWIVVEVTDTGIGIPAEDHARIFDTFYQVADPRAEASVGTGLGLAIARRLVELHQGRLWLKSQPDHGSSFFLALRAQRR